MSLCINAELKTGAGPDASPGGRTARRVSCCCSAVAADTAAVECNENESNSQQHSAALAYTHSLTHSAAFSRLACWANIIHTDPSHCTEQLAALLMQLFVLQVIVINIMPQPAL